MDELFWLLAIGTAFCLCMRHMLHSAGYYYDGEEEQEHVQDKT